MDIALALEIQKEINHSKLQGLDATRKAISSWNHNQEYNWQLIAISNETANKLLQGEFKTFEELETSKFENKIYLLSLVSDKTFLKAGFPLKISRFIVIWFLPQNQIL